MGTFFRGLSRYNPFPPPHPVVYIHQPVFQNGGGGIYFTTPKIRAVYKRILLTSK